MGKKRLLSLLQSTTYRQECDKNLKVDLNKNLFYAILTFNLWKTGGGFQHFVCFWFFNKVIFEKHNSLKTKLICKSGMTFDFITQTINTWMVEQKVKY